MRRGAYVGTAGVSNTGYPSIPMQIETINYLARFSSQPSNTYKNALNQAIYRWKAAGVYSLLTDLWLTCADASADSLRNLISASRDATITGSPTFTALTGFGGISTSNYLSFPFTTSGLVAGTCGCIFAGKAPPNMAGAHLIGTNNSKAGSVNPAFYMGGCPLTNLPAAYDTTISTVSDIIIGGVGGVSVNSQGATASTSAPGSFETSPVSCNISAAMNTMQAYGFMAAPTAAQVRKFLSILTLFLDDIGSL